MNATILVERKDYQKMTFIMNALNRGWKIKKISNSDKYVFFRKHEGKQEIFLDSYLEGFIENSIGHDNIFSHKVPAA